MTDYSTYTCEKCYGNCVHWSNRGDVFITLKDDDYRFPIDRGICENKDAFMHDAPTQYSHTCKYFKRVNQLSKM